MPHSLEADRSSGDELWLRLIVALFLQRNTSSRQWKLRSSNTRRGGCNSNMSRRWHVSRIVVCIISSYMYTATVILPMLQSYHDLVLLESDVDHHISPRWIRLMHQKDNSHASDDKCKRTFEWSMIENWQSDDKAFDLDNLPQYKVLSLERMGGLHSNGTSDMMITVRSPNLKLIVVDTTAHISDLKDKDNLWHRHAALYGSWVGVQVARLKYNMTGRTVYVHDCNNGDFPLEWRNLGELSCDRSLVDQADVVILPPLEGLLWDIAWDFDFECQHAKMFNSYVSLFVDKRSKVKPTEDMGCWISRRGSNVRTVHNLNDVLRMMRELFPRVEEMIFTPSKTANQTAEMIQECRVLIGVHGAGHTNALYARPGVAIVEIVGKDHPAYFRNINMLMGQNYQSIVGDATKGIFDDMYNIDLEEARARSMDTGDDTLFTGLIASPMP